MPERALLEICVDSVESALAAQAGGADRVELCSALFEGGLTPSAGLLKTVRDQLKIGIAAMIRPRGGDFFYSADEFAAMEYDLKVAKDLGADLIVLGLLNPDGTIDADRTRRLVELSRPLPVTFHRAFDMTSEPWAALETLLDIGIDRLLTSGQEVTPVEGMELIAAMIARVGNRMIIMPGGGVTERNIQKLLNHTKAREIHSSAGGMRESRMTFRNTRVFMGGQLGPPEFALKIAREERVRTFRELIG